MESGSEDESTDWRRSHGPRSRLRTEGPTCAVKLTGEWLRKNFNITHSPAYLALLDPQSLEAVDGVDDDDSFVVVVGADEFVLYPPYDDDTSKISISCAARNRLDNFLSSNANPNLLHASSSSSSSSSSATTSSSSSWFSSSSTRTAPVLPISDSSYADQFLRTELAAGNRTDTEPELNIVRQIVTYLLSTTV